MSYIANILAGARFEWMLQDLEMDAANEASPSTYGRLLPQIEAEAKEMQAVFA